MTIAMRGVSRESFAVARETLDTLIRSGDTDLRALADDLFAVLHVLDREASLRRNLTDPARSGDDRAGLARAVFDGRIGAAALDLLVWAARARWSTSRDLADSVELLAVEALVAAAQQEDRLDAVEDELFRVARIVSAAPQLRAALADVTVPADRRVALVEGLLSGKVTDETLRLVRQAVVAPRGRTLEHTLETYSGVAAERRSRMVATVLTAVPLAEQQRDRLAALLAEAYGQKVQLNIEVDPDLIGGVRVEIGDEVIDGSIVSKLEDARRRLAG